MRESLSAAETDPAAGSVLSTVKPRQNAFASLDFLRGISALAVFLGHTASNVNGVGFMAKGGPFAVDVFMFISGFLMMWHYYERLGQGETWDNPRTCLKFYVRRFFRIAPLYYFMLLIVCVFDQILRSWARQNEIALHNFDPAVEAAMGHQTASSILAHFSFVFGFMPRYSMCSLLPDWSIGLEMQFYLFFPFIALLLVRSQFVGGILLLLAVNGLSLKLFGIGVGAAPKALGVFPMATFLPLRLDRFLVGMLMAAGLFEEKNLVRRMFLIVMGLAVSGIYLKKFLLVCCLFAGYELVCRGGTGLPWVDAVVRAVSQWGERRIVKFGADVSYGVYLIHAPLLAVVVHFLLLTCPFAGMAPAERYVLCLAVAGPIVYVLAYLAHRYIESPGIDWGRAVVKRIGRNKAVKPSIVGGLV